MCDAHLLPVTLLQRTSDFSPFPALPPVAASLQDDLDDRPLSRVWRGCDMQREIQGQRTLTQAIRATLESKPPKGTNPPSWSLSFFLDCTIVD